MHKTSYPSWDLQETSPSIRASLYQTWATTCDFQGYTEEDLSCFRVIWWVNCFIQNPRHTTRGLSIFQEISPDDTVLFTTASIESDTDITSVVDSFCAFLTKQAVVIMGPWKDLISDHQLVIDIMHSIQDCNPNLFNSY